VRPGVRYPGVLLLCTPPLPFPDIHDHISQPLVYHIGASQNEPHGINGTHFHCTSVFTSVATVERKIPIADELVSMTAVTTAMERVARTECEKMKINVENLTMDLCFLKKRLDQMDSHPTATSQVQPRKNTTRDLKPIFDRDPHWRNKRQHRRNRTSETKRATLTWLSCTVFRNGFWDFLARSERAAVNIKTSISNLEEDA